MTAIDSFSEISNLTTLPEGVYIRTPRKDEYEAITQMINACELADGEEPHNTPEDLLAQWNLPGFDLEQDAWVAVAAPVDGLPEELIIGYEEVWNRQGHAALQGDGYVHPEFRDLGIGTALLRQMEARARQHIPLADNNRRVYVRNGTLGTDVASHELHKNEGYRPIRYMWRMEINMIAPPPEPVWPAGVVLQPFDAKRHTRPVFDALEEAFRDHWGYLPWNFDVWQQRMTQKEDFDPCLYFVAWDTSSTAPKIAGAALCSYQMENGWVNQLAVRRPYRRLGLGLALLNHALAEFYRRGTYSVGLGVDASNPTGATRLYEKAGMHVAKEYVLFEKELRPGEDWQMEEE